MDANKYAVEKVPFHKTQADGRKVYCGMGTRLVEHGTGRVIATVLGHATRADLVRQFVAECCAHTSAVSTPDGHGAYCERCGETLG